MKLGFPLFVVLILAGCIGAGAPEEGPVQGSSTTNAAPLAATGEAAPATATEDTGSISVSVVTSELQPVEAAQVVLEGKEQSAFTDTSGVATFNGLEAGKYTVLAAKPGYKPQSEKGKLVDVLAGEITEVKMVLDPDILVSAETKYHKTVILNGFISCSFNGSTGLGYTSYCGRGVFISGGPQLGDPNDKTVHNFDIDNPLIQTIVMDVVWTPSFSALSTDLHSSLYARWLCGAGAGTTGQTCDANDGIESGWGKSPLNYREEEGERLNITKRIAKYHKEYPVKVYSLHRAWCPPGCVASVALQQKFDAWATTFYGESAPPGFSTVPKK